MSEVPGIDWYTILLKPHSSHAFTIHVPEFKGPSTFWPRAYIMGHKEREMNIWEKHGIGLPVRYILPRYIWISNKPGPTLGITTFYQHTPGGLSLILQQDRWALISGAHSGRRHGRDTAHFPADNLWLSKRMLGGNQLRHQ